MLDSRLWCPIVSQFDWAGRENLVLDRIAIRSRSTSSKIPAVDLRRFVLSSAHAVTVTTFRATSHGTAGSGLRKPPYRARGAARPPQRRAAALARCAAGSPPPDGAAAHAAHQPMRRRLEAVDGHRGTPRAGSGPAGGAAHGMERGRDPTAARGVVAVSGARARHRAGMGGAAASARRTDAPAPYASRDPHGDLRHYSRVGADGARTRRVAPCDDRTRHASAYG